MFNSMKAGILDDVVIAEIKKLHGHENKDNNISDTGDDNTKQSNNADIDTKQSKGNKGTIQIKTHGIVKHVLRSPRLSNALQDVHRS